MKKLKKVDWDITANRYVAFIDIMGFKDMVARSPHHAIYKMMKEINKAKLLNESIEWEKGKSKLIKSTFFSDSILLYTKDDTYDSANAIFCTLCSLTSDLLCSAIPHKGALAFGKLTLDFDNSIFFGQPLIDAYLLQEELNLYCIVVHSSAEHETDKQKHDLGFYEYKCPFKGGATNHLTIQPLFAGLPSEGNLKEERKINEGINKLRYKTSGHLRRYIDNTQLYLENLKLRPE